MIRVASALLAVALCLVGWASSGAAQDVLGWEGVLEEQLARYPAMRAEDVYKLAHQATFGPAHLISNVAAARGYLQQELARVVASREEPLWERLAADPPLVRVNLRPFKACGGDVEQLLAALVATAETVHGQASAMRARLAVAVEVLLTHGQASEAERLRQLCAELETKGFPPVHHSAAYTQAYQPAYRVVRRDLLERGH